MENQNRAANCRNCVSREFITNRGLVCKRTGSNPDFERECADFEYDKEIEKIAPLPVINPDDPAQLSEEVLLREENMPKAILYGLAAAVVGSVLWAAVSTSTGLRIGLIVFGMAYAVGYAVRKGGKGIRPVFGIVGAFITFIGCVLGECFSLTAIVAKQANADFFEVLSVIFKSGDMFPLILANFSPVSYLVYLFAIFQAYKLSFRVQIKDGGKI